MDQKIENEPNAEDFRVLGLSQRTNNITEKEITRAYKNRALELHPDKRPKDEPNTHIEFQNLNSSYEKLKRWVQIDGQFEQPNNGGDFDGTQFDAKLKRRASEMDERERKLKEREWADRVAKAKEDRIQKKLNEEITDAGKRLAQEITRKDNRMRWILSGGGGGVPPLERNKVLKVSWKRGIGDYPEARLRELFEVAGEVEFVVIRSRSRKTGSALVVMASEEGVVAAARTVLGDDANPLIVRPLQEEASTSAHGQRIRNLDRTGFQSFENSVLGKCRKAVTTT